MENKVRLKTPITYYGGKQTMLKHILPLIPKHSIYTEAFCGGCAVLFAKEPVKTEVINDINDELINFYRVTKEKFPLLKWKIDTVLHSRSMHQYASNIMSQPDFYSDIDRAWAIYVRSKTSFASRLDAVFGYDMSGTMPRKIDYAKKNFTHEIQQRLERVTIENRDAIKVIKTYDREGAFHFVDPPYIGSDCGHYKGTFAENDFINLLDTLSSLKGMFMLTMFPHKAIEQYSAKYGWTIHRFERTISASRVSRKKKEEWIVCNYRI